MSKIAHPPTTTLVSYAGALYVVVHQLPITPAAILLLAAALVFP